MECSAHHIRLFGIGTLCYHVLSYKLFITLMHFHFPIFLPRVSILTRDIDSKSVRPSVCPLRSGIR